MDKLDTMKVFVEVASGQSFVAASRSLGMSPPAVTRAIAQLEHSLGVTLFNRTTRHVRLTEAGARYFVDAKHVLDLVDEVEAGVSGTFSKPKGVLALTAPVLFGQKHVVPILTDYLQLYPEVDVNALFYDRVSNIIDEGLDVAVRIGPLKDSSLYAIHVGDVRRFVCAAPSYLEQHGTPTQPSDLADHEIIQATQVEATTTWRFRTSSGKTETVALSPRLFCSQNGAAIEAAKRGLGITRVMSYQVGEELLDGSLQCILQDAETDPFPVHVVHLEGRKANAKVRAFVDLAVERLRANPFI